MENERTYREEKKGLTLADVGVPDYTEQKWRRLSHLNRIVQGHLIQGSHVNLDDPIPQDNMSVFKHQISYYLHDFQPYVENMTSRQIRNSVIRRGEIKKDLSKKLSFLDKPDITWRQLTDRLRKVAPTDYSFRKAISQITPGTFLEEISCPYFTNNFVCFFSQPTHDGEWTDAAKGLIEQHGYAGPTDHKELWTFEGFRATYPYFIALNRQGFSKEELSG